MPSKLPRSASAYENTICEEESEEEHFPTSSNFCDNDTEEVFEATVKTEVIEISLPRDADQPNGMAFRMVGSRSRGVFIDHVHPGSPQNGPLREGDRLLRVNKISLRAVSVDQAASIFRFWMHRTSTLNLQVERRADGESVMSRRRRQARLSMCNEQREQRSFGKATLRMTSSRSAEVFCHEPVAPRSKPPQYELFETAHYSKNICPHCNAQTRLLYLHQFSHGFVHNAFRFLTSSRSSYSLL